MKYHNRFTGNELLKAFTPFYVFLLFGLVLTIVGAVGWRSRRRYE